MRTKPTIPDPWPFRPWLCVERGGRPESYHEGILVVVDDAGTVRARWGDPDWPAYLRSSLKMVQALPLVESGAADAFALSRRHLAVACASHSGELVHVAAVEELLDRAGVGLEALRCGAHAPLDRSSRRDLIRAGEDPRPVHNNCSGKHAGMLATCAHSGWDLATYTDAEHPLQRRIAGVLGELTDLAPDDLDYAVDGCGVPTFRVPLVRFALALARYVGGNGPARGHRAATQRLFDAMFQRADLVAGTARVCTELARAATRPVIAKGGAEGLYVVAWREDSGQGVALVAKAADGDERGRDFAVTEAMAQLGLLTSEGLERVRPFHSAPLLNHAGTEVGRRVALFDLDGART